MIETTCPMAVTPVETLHDFRSGSFDHLADPRDDFAELLDSMCEADSEAIGPFDHHPHYEVRMVTYKIGSVLRQRVETVITTRPTQ